MKTYKIFTIAVVAILSLGSCTNFLTTQLTSSKTSDSYYQTPSDAATALVGCYNGLDLIWNSGVAVPLMAEVESDNCFGGTGSSDGYGYEMMDEFNKSVSPSDVSLFEGDWEAYYQAIYRCNTLIGKIGQVNWGKDTASAKTDEGEAKFLRAYLYYDLVRLFEKVPLITVPTMANVPQASPDSTYAQIISDLKYAAANLPSTPYPNVVNGRATKWAAEAMLARVFLFYTGYYGKADCAGFTKADALAAIDDVRDNSGYGLVTDYTTLWPAASAAKGVTYAGEDNKEVIFSIKYTGNGNYSGNITGNPFAIMTGMRIGAGGGTSIYPYAYGWGAATVDPKLWNAFSASDSRRFASITSITDEGLDTKYTTITGKAFTGDNNREYTGYYLKKYSPMCDSLNNALPNTNYLVAQPQDYFDMRYADVLLMAAELELGTNSGQALIDFNRVHTRAGLTAATSITLADIMNERRLEFAGEGIRYWDLLRQGIQTAATTIVANTTASYLSDGTSSPAITVANIEATRGFQQIPENQITLSGGVLKQNAGW
ncbi:RagB/SusD family nutrient uptake outer membrane protein [Microbacter margulisiae]|uniref:RagB/SusD family nutrient uptake outer membrane protein n=1 Tax=Microbacter margulisiae TaxID=1350067 RepID=A0A7W5DSX4_9PORP|nr:RagB/SusD family nutrient uptake outer membrane protein [Microbacter margulisiae]MBB3188486.1 hypothetical protein [Microbacter margulisiae]